MRWSEAARETIGRIHAGLPADATYEQRVAVLRAGYPFGARENHPYKAWLKAQRAYLGKFRRREGVLVPREHPTLFGPLV